MKKSTQFRLTPLALACALLGAGNALATTSVATEAELRNAIIAINGGAADTAIALTAGITLTQSLPMMTASMSIDGGNFTLDANNAGRVFFVQAGTASIANVTIANARAQGGAGGAANRLNGGGGGGGLGAGAAVFVYSGATANLSAVTVNGAGAIGGAGGTGAGTADNGTGGGGGGLGGAGGNGASAAGAGGGGYAGAGGSAGGSGGGGGGGGEFGAGGTGDQFVSTGGGEGGGATANGNAGSGLGGGAGGSAEGGNGGNNAVAGSAGGARGGGGGGGARAGGAGGLGGGGGGGFDFSGGAGGAFGGGGSTGNTNAVAGGAGGYGGGGGGARTNVNNQTGGAGGFGAGGGGGQNAGAAGTYGGAGGAGAGADGGGGAALGGAFYVADGGALSLDGTTLTGSYTVTGGIGDTHGGGAGDGQALGKLMFVLGTGTTTLTVASGSLTLADAGALAGTGALAKAGAGTLLVNGANANYSGAFAVNAGTLGGTGSLGGTATVAAGAKLAPGNSAGTLTFANLVLNNTSALEFELGNPAGVAGTDSDLIQVNGDLTLDGVINVTNLAGFGAGTYRLINYTGTLTNNTLTVGTLPSGYSATVDTATANQINLVVVAIAPAPVYSPPAVIYATPGGTTTLSDTTPVTASPGSTLVIPAGAALSGTVITLSATSGASGAPVTIKIGANTLTVTPLGGDAVLTLKTVTIDGVATLVLALGRGTVSIGAGPGQPVIMFINGGVIASGAQGGSVSQAMNGDGTASLSVTSGTVILPANAFAEVKDNLLHAGEIAQIGSDGKVTQVRLGSLGGSGAVGDPLTLKADPRRQMPKALNLAGKLGRLGEQTPLAAIAAALGQTSLAQNADGTLEPGIAAIPVGAGVDTSRADGVTRSGGVTEVAVSGLVFRLVPTVNDFAAFLAAIDPAASATLDADGMLSLVAKGRQYAGRAGLALQAASGADGFSLDAAGNLVWTRAGQAQTLYPALRILEKLRAELTAFDPQATLSDNGDGNYTVSLNGQTYTLRPDFRLLNLFDFPAQHAKDGWWLNGAKVFLNYGNVTAQGMAVW